VAPSAALAARGVAAGAPLHWSAAAFAERPPYASPTPIDEVSCATASDCVAIDAQGDVLTSASPAGGAAAWHLTPDSVGRFTNVAHTAPALSCVAAAPVLCVGLDNGHIETSTRPAGGPKAWHAAHLSLSLLDSISCTSATFCLAGGVSGLEVSTDPAGGAAAWQSIGVGLENPRVSCASSSFCAAIDDSLGSSGDVLTSGDPDGGASAWKSTDIAGSVTLTDIGCPSASLCVATDSAGDVLTSTRPTDGASAWHHVSVRATITSITCPSAAECVGTGSGTLVTSTDPTGKASAWHVVSEPWVPGAGDLSCPTTRLCVAGNQADDIITSADPGGGAKTWQPPVDLDGANAITKVACPSATLCVAGDAHGNVLTSTDPAARRWKLAYADGKPPSPAEAGITGLKCPDRSLCVATDPRGDVITSTHPAGGAPAWHSVRPSSTAQNILDLACAGAKVCAAISTFGQLITTTDVTGGAAWQVFTIPDLDSIGTLACPSTRLCFVTGLGQNDTRPVVWYSTDPEGGPITWKEQFGNVLVPPFTCVSASFCIGPDGAGVISSTSPAGENGWTVTPIHLPVPGSSMSAAGCASASLCVAGDSRGDLFTGRPPA
jgi:hypothetical protein